MPPAHDCFGRGCELAGHFRFGRRGGRDNAILVTHHFSGTSHAAGRYRADDAQPGSWDAIVGPGKAIDTDRYYVVSSDTLVSLNAKDPDTVTTGPASVDPATGRPHGMSFPIVTIRDSVNVQKALLDLWAAPIRLDPAWNGDDYYGRAEPARGLVEALKLVTLQATQWHWVDRVFGRSWADPAKSPPFTPWSTDSRSDRGWSRPPRREPHSVTPITSSTSPGPTSSSCSATAAASRRTSGRRVIYTEAITTDLGHLDGLAHIDKAAPAIAAFLAEA